MLRSIGINPAIDLFAFNNVDTDVLTRHIALDDAKIVRETFLKIMHLDPIKNIIESCV